MPYHINPTSTETQIIGLIPLCIIDYYSLTCASPEVYLPPGVIKHLKKRNHWDDFLAHYEQIPSIISTPDYVGQNPKEPHTIEIYKSLSEHIILPIKLNESDALFMSSFYTLDNGLSKIEKRIRTCRILPFSFFDPLD